MVMSWFGDQLDSFAPEAESEEDRQRREAQAQPSLGAAMGAPPSGTVAGSAFGNAFAQPVFGPPAPEIGTGLNPNQGGFRGPENPANITPGDQYAPNPDMGFLDLGNIQSATRIPVYSDFAENTLIPAVSQAADPLGIQSFIQQNTVGTDIGMGDLVVPVTGFDVALNAATGGGLTGFDDLARAGAAGLGAADNAFRAAMPEPQLIPGYGAGLNQFDAQGILRANGISQADIDAFTASMNTAPPGTIENAVSDASAAARGAYNNTPGAPADQLAAARQAAASTYDEGIGNTDAALQEELRQARIAADEDAALAQGLWGQTAAPPVVDDTARQMQQALDNARALEGGGLPVEASADVASPPPSSLTAEEIGNTMRQADIDAGFTPAGGGQPPNIPPPPTTSAASPAPGGPLGGGTTTMTTGLAPTPQAIQAQTATIAGGMGIPPTQATTLADDVVKNWLYNAQITQDFTPTPGALGRVTSAVEGAVTGNFADSFVAGLAQRQNELEAALSRVPSLTPADIKARVEAATNARLADHFQNDATKIAAVKQTLADADKKAAELARDFRGLNTAWDRVKNTLFPIDVGFFGQNILTGVRQSGIPTIAGMANRAALALHMPFATNLEATTGLPRILAATNDGLNLGRQASGLNVESGSLLRYVPGLSAVDKHAVTPLINGLTDAQYKGLGGWLKMMNHEGNLTILGAMGKDISDPAVRRQSAQMVNNAWSSANTATTPGRAQLERLSFTSPAFTRSQVGAINDMTKLITPSATETQRILAATAILSNIAMVAGVYKFLNDQFGVTDAELDPTKPGFGNITLPGTDSEGKHNVINLFPQRSFQLAATRSIDAIVKGNPEALAEAGARLASGRMDYLPGTAVRGALGAGYDTQGNFSMGGMPLEERFKASIPAPVSLQNFVFGGATDPRTMALELGGIPNYQERTGSQLFRENSELRGLRSEALMNPALLASAFPDNPAMARSLTGVEYKDLTTEEKRAVDKALAESNPRAAHLVTSLAELSDQYQDEKPSAIGYAIQRREETDAAIDGIRQDYGKNAFPLLEKQLFDGQHDPYVVRQTITELEKSMRADMALEAWKGSTTYAGLPEQKSDRPKELNSDVEDAIQSYRAIGSSIPKDKDGRPDYDAVNNVRVEFMRELQRTQPETFERLSYYIQQREQRAEETKPDILKLFDYVQSTSLNAYYDQPEGTRTQWLRENPRDNAMLWLVGYQPAVYSPQAANLAHAFAPERKVEVRR